MFYFFMGKIKEIDRSEVLDGTFHEDYERALLVNVPKNLKSSN